MPRTRLRDSDLTLWLSLAAHQARLGQTRLVSEGSAEKCWLWSLFLPYKEASARVFCGLLQGEPMDVRAGSAWRPVALWFRELSGVAGKSDIDLKASFDFDGHFTAEEKGQDSAAPVGLFRGAISPSSQWAILSKLTRVQAPLTMGLTFEQTCIQLG